MRDQVEETDQAIILGRNKWFEANYPKGQVVTFIHPEHGLVGATVISGRFCGYFGKGGIPDFLVDVIGRKKQVMRISLVKNHLHPSKDWAEANSKIKGTYYDDK